MTYSSGVRALVVRAPGTNCDAEMCRAFELAGARVDIHHVEALCADPSLISEYGLIGFPGGFSYGDDIASGRVFAVKIRERLYGALREAAMRGCPMIGACNGFQVLVQTGLLPGPLKGKVWPEEPQLQVMSLTDNKDARFCDRWVGVSVEPGTACIWTRGLEEGLDEQGKRDVLSLPVAHGEGRFVTDNGATLKALEAGGQVALRYTDNYNGSMGAVAGVCDASGRIFGLMPHPERFLEWNRHPYWTRLNKETMRRETPGLAMFRNAVALAKT